VNLRNLSIKTRLSALVIGGLVLLAAAAAGNLYGLRLAVDSGKVVADAQTRLAGSVDRLGDDIANLRRYEKDVLLNLDKADAVAGYIGKWNETHSRLVAEVQKLEPTLAAEGKALLKEFATAEAAYAAATLPVLEKAKAGALDNAATGNAALKPAKEHIYKAEQVLDAGTKRIQGQLDDARKKVDDFTGQLQLAMLAVLAAAIAIGSVLGWLVVRSILAPLESGVAFARRVAEGDLSATPDTSGRDEMAALMKALAHMSRELSAVVGEVRQAGESIQTASAEVASGNADLSQRTEETASQLQQTSSSMSQLTTTVQQSADAARQASQLASSAAEVAGRGGAVVSEVVTTMDRINTSSRKIADIIGTIDGIAFQTNILALNAAVEAARAGEQGRGFAVVAGEVRSLASRSAEAAREIKSLIAASVENVDSGSRLVADAGETMNEIVASVQRVSDIIGEISAAATEQSTGIAAVNQTVSQLDQMTQQNAALVEQSAAAAESLKEQAVRLASTVTRFQVGRESYASQPRPAAAPAASALPMRSAAPAKVAQQVIARAATPRPAAAPAPASAPAPRAAPEAPASRSAAAPAAAGSDDWETF
jgi:methyl-accepting chemotaxis protein